MLASAMALSEFWLAHWPAAVGLPGSGISRSRSMRCAFPERSPLPDARRTTRLGTRSVRDARAHRRTEPQRAVDAARQEDRAGRAGFVMFIDLDDFKRVNDLHGHAAGDELPSRGKHHPGQPAQHRRVGEDWRRRIAVTPGGSRDRPAGRSRTRSSRRYRSSPTIPLCHSVRDRNQPISPGPAAERATDIVARADARCTTPSAAETASASSPPSFVVDVAPDGNRWRRARCSPRRLGSRNQPLTACADSRRRPARVPRRRRGSIGKAGGPHHAVTPRILRAIERLVRIVQHHLDPPLPSDRCGADARTQRQHGSVGVRSVVHAAIAHDSRRGRSASLRRNPAATREITSPPPARSACRKGGSPTGMMRAIVSAPRRRAHGRAGR